MLPYLCFVRLCVASRLICLRAAPLSAMTRARSPFSKRAVNRLKKSKRTIHALLPCSPFSSRGSATEAVTRGRVAGTRSFYKTRMHYSGDICKGASTDLPNGNGTEPIFGLQCLNLLAICPISGRTSTDSSRKRNLWQALSTNCMLCPKCILPCPW